MTMTVNFGAKSTLHQHLRSWRLYKGLSIAAFAAFIGKPNGTYREWENGRRAMKLDEIASIAEHLGVHPSRLLFHPGDEFRIVLPSVPKEPDPAPEYVRASTKYSSVESGRCFL